MVNASRTAPVSGSARTPSSGSLQEPEAENVQQLTGSTDYQVYKQLTWRRLQVVLRNTRNTYAREHPFFVCKAIFKHAARHAGSGDAKLDFLFHPSHAPLPRRVSKKHAYAFDLIFPTASEATVEAFAEGLRKHCAQAKNNFHLDSLSAPETRRLADLRAERLPALDLSADEVCLDFVSPLDFRPVDPRRPHLLSADSLLRFATVHLARLFPEAGLPAQVATGDLVSLSHYWEPISGKSGPIRHHAKSQPGHVFLRGQIGPLYLRGDWQAHLPLLLLGSELQTGYGKGDETLIASEAQRTHGIAHGHGGYRLQTGRNCLDRALADPNRFQAVRRELAEESAVAEELHESLDCGEALARDVHASVRDGSYRPDPIRLCDIPKNSGGRRRISLLTARDRIHQGTLHALVADAFDRMFCEGAVGYRPGHSVGSARELLREALKAGHTYAIRADIADFFDAIDWELMDARIDEVLPRADRRLRETLKTVYRADERIDAERSRPRERGLPQGSPLSPLLANLYLTPFDEALAADGLPCIRFGDDFVVLINGLQAAEEVLEMIATRLGELKLSLHPEKTAIHPIDGGFRFLGQDYPTTFEEEAVAPLPQRKSLYVQERFTFTGLDGRSVLVRKNKEALAKLPLERLGELVFFGDGAVSHRLLTTCAQEGIPVSFCSPTGWHLATLRPDSRLWFRRLARHHRRYEALGESGQIAVARAVARAKLVNYRAWLQSLPGGETAEALPFLEQCIRALDQADSADALRGHEGAAAARLFPALNRRLKQSGFEAAKREPRAKPDPYNLLLDFFYSRLFTRLNVLLRGTGLDPYLGCLHSGKDNYESLVCDLQEPFRARMDCLVHRLINTRAVNPADFVDPGGSQHWKIAPGPTMGKLLEAFSREENVRLAGEASTLGQLLHAQCQSLRRWVDGQSEKIDFFEA